LDLTLAVTWADKEAALPGPFVSLAEETILLEHKTEEAGDNKMTSAGRGPAQWPVRGQLAGPPPDLRSRYLVEQVTGGCRGRTLVLEEVAIGHQELQPQAGHQHLDQTATTDLLDLDQTTTTTTDHLDLDQTTTTTDHLDLDQTTTIDHLDLDQAITTTDHLDLDQTTTLDHLDLDQVETTDHLDLDLTSTTGQDRKTPLEIGQKNSVEITDQDLLTIIITTDHLGPAEITTDHQAWEELETGHPDLDHPITDHLGTGHQDLLEITTTHPALVELTANHQGSEEITTDHQDLVVVDPDLHQQLQPLDHPG